MKKNVIVLYGGRSVEHDISIITAIQTISSVDIVRYNVYPIYMKGGAFYYIESHEKISNYTSFDYKKHKRVAFDSENMYEIKGSKGKKGKKIHCAILCNHGGEGENGSLQGYLNVLGIPYTSAEVLGSAIGMNKYIQKLVAVNEGIKTLPAVRIDLSAYDRGEVNLGDIFVSFKGKIMVKPVNLGSSIGVSVATSITEFRRAVELVSFYDAEALAEDFLDNSEEYNCSLCRTGGGIKYGRVERVEKTHSYLTFDDKYIGDGSKGMASQKREFVEGEIEQRIKEISKTLYDALSLSGIVRIDYLVKNNEIYFNEVNTIPGSLSYYLYGDDFSDILTEIIEKSVLDTETKEKRTLCFSSSMLSSTVGLKNGKKTNK